MDARECWRWFGALQFAVKSATSQEEQEFYELWMWELMNGPLTRNEPKVGTWSQK